MALLGLAVSAGGGGSGGGGSGGCRGVVGESQFHLMSLVEQWQLLNHGVTLKGTSPAA